VLSNRVRSTIEGPAREASSADPSSKPNIAKTILQEEGMHAALDGKLVISICAGVTISQLKSWVPESVNVVRAMPNTPCKVRSFNHDLIPLGPSPRWAEYAPLSACEAIHRLESHGPADTDRRSGKE